MNNGKQCNECGVVKPLAEFHKNKSTKDGHQYKCRECAKATTAAWFAANKDRAAATGAAWYAENKDRKAANNAAWFAANKDRAAATGAAWYAENKDRAATTSAAWRAANKDRVAATKAAWYAENKARKAATDAAWQKANPENLAAKKHRRRALQSNNGINLVTPAEHAAIAAQPCAACDAPAPSEVDHIVPIARGGAHTIGNLMPLCRSCNASKRDMLYAEWKHSSRARAIEVFA